ncbi:MAG: outer membrane beta-barrel protein [Muribaculaceae bacterium]|nr:outer membrane beta-barrel protein [Muribaculaceae bacterium]
MKKIIALSIVAIASIASCFTLRAESRWGVTAGANYNEIHFKFNDLFDSKRQFGAIAGVTGEMMFSGIGFGVDGSLLYSMRGGKLDLGSCKTWSSLGLGNETCTLHYIDVPLNLKFKVRNLSGFENTLCPIVFFGPTVSVLAGHSDMKDQLSYNKVCASLHFGIGADILNKVQLNMGYSFGVGENLKTKLLDDNTAKNRRWFATLTWFFE